MHLSQFIRSHAEEILDAWDEFAATIPHPGEPMDQKALRDHAAEILLVIADDLDQPQSKAEQSEKSRGLAPRDVSAGDTAAETHADTRMVSGFPIAAMLTEYRALRASVLSLWAGSGGNLGDKDAVDQLTRFNEAVDQAIAESVGRYDEKVQQYTDLFIGMVGHDIRNPLGTISMSAEVLVRSGQLSGKAAAPIVNGARRIESIVEQILDFSRGQAGGVMPLDLRPGDLQQHCSAVIAETQVRHPTARLVLNASGDFAGHWDQGRIGQLLSNLLENAVTYGARQQPITVTLSSDAEQVHVWVHNRGKAIALDERAAIFEPRSRGSASREYRVSSGLGLGLYICREIVRAHHGTLSVRSEEGEGTTFTMNIPRPAKPAEPTAEPAGDTEGVRAA